jgi:hypothetical protein
MRKEHLFLDYLKVVFQAPVGILFAILDIATVVGVFMWVADDIGETAVLVAFVIVIHAGHFLIFRQERVRSQELVREIGGLTDRLPVLRLRLSGDSASAAEQCMELQPDPVMPNVDELIAKEEAQLRSEYERTASGPTKEERIVPRAGISLIIDRLKGKDEFEKDVKDYLLKFRQYQTDLYDFRMRFCRLRPISLELSNEGRVPATDIAVLLHFPGSFRFPSEEDLADIEVGLQEPQPPAAPSPHFSLLGDIRDIVAPLSAGLPLDAIVQRPSLPPNVRGPFVRRARSTEVAYEIDKLLHGFSASLDPIYVYIADELIGRGGSIHFTIHCSELPEPVRGSLAVRASLVDPVQ